MAAQPETRTESYRCPECDGAVLFAHGAWGCTSCRYVPPHSAD
jgi:ribosomal protein L37AE/L43A